MHLLHTQQSSIQNRNERISVLNEALWDMQQVHSGIWASGLQSISITLICKGIIELIDNKVSMS